MNLEGIWGTTTKDVGRFFDRTCHHGPDEICIEVVILTVGSPGLWTKIHDSSWEALAGKTGSEYRSNGAT